MPIETIVHPTEAPLFNVFGPLRQFLISPSDASGAFGLIRAAVPPSIERTSSFSKREKMRGENPFESAE